MWTTLLEFSLTFEINEVWSAKTVSKKGIPEELFTCLKPCVLLLEKQSVFNPLNNYTGLASSFNL